MRYSKRNVKEKSVNKKDLLKFKKKKKEEVINAKKDQKLFEKVKKLSQRKKQVM